MLNRVELRTGQTVFPPTSLIRQISATTGHLILPGIPLYLRAFRKQTIIKIRKICSPQVITKRLELLEGKNQIRPQLKQLRV
jgi:hypothetical protein